MTVNASLSRRDEDVLAKIRDPESDPSAAVRIDSSLPKDPHVTDPKVYSQLVDEERALVRVLQQAELEIDDHRRSDRSLARALNTYRETTDQLAALVERNPNYASGHNNLAQALRRLYGDDMLLDRCWTEDDPALLQGKEEGEEAMTSMPSLRPPPLLSLTPSAFRQTTYWVPDTCKPTSALPLLPKTLHHLDRAISLLLDKEKSETSQVLSPTAANTLSLAFTQRAALYHTAAKQLLAGQRHPMSKSPLLHPLSDPDSASFRPEGRWSHVDFEEAAARDFAMGGRFGNEIARGLAVGTNPTAKLCGQMVQQMMKKEYGS